MREIRFRKVWGLCVFAGLTAGCPSEETVEGTSPVAHVVGNASSPLGVNLDFVDYWSAQWPWKDAMKLAGDWLTAPNQQTDPFVWDSGVIDMIPKDADGYPLSLPVTVAGTQAPQIVHTLILRTEGLHPKGQYTCLYDGDGTIEFEMDATIVSQAPGKIAIQVNPTNEGIHLRITKSTQGNHIRNIRLLMPGFNDLADPWHPTFLERLKKFSVVRFGLFQKILWSTQETWEKRSTKTYYTQASERAVAVEWMVDLANRLGADPWFHMPHKATDDYVKKFATYVRDNLDPKRRAYLEYSNETWNSTYSVHEYARNQGLALGLSNDPFEAALRFTAKRAVEIFTIWEGVFGNAKRLVRVLASQSSVPWTGETLMDWQDAYKNADALAIGPYFGGGLGGNPQTKQMTVDQVLDGCNADIVGDVAVQITDNLKEAKKRGLDLIAYEGGQHLVGVGALEEDATLNSLFDAANRHARMKDLYRKHLDQWKALGGKLFNHHSFISVSGKYGRFGLLENQLQDPAKAVKFQAVQEFIDKNPRWW